MTGKRFEMGLLLLALSACNTAVDLDQKGHVTPSSDPSVLGTLDEWVVHLAVDDRRIYWSTDAGAVRSCNMSDCAGSVTTYTELFAVASAGLVVQGGELFYATSNEERPTFPGQVVARDPGITPGLIAVKVDDPSDRRLVLADANPTALAVDELGACLVGGLGGLSCLSFVIQGALPVTITLTSGFRPLLAMHGEHVYWMGTIPDDALLRTRRDGSGTIEFLSDGVELDTSKRNDLFDAEYGLAIDDGHIYFSQNVLAGSLARCPLDGCTARPELVLDAIRSPMGLRRHASQLYFLHEPDGYQYSLSSCEVSACEPTLVATGLAGKRAMAVTDDFAYAAVTNYSPGQVQSRPAAATQLRRFAQ